MEKPVGNPNAVFVVKFVEPLLGLVGISLPVVTVISRGKGLFLLWVFAPGYLLAAFLLTAAQIRPEGDHVRYRRFGKWKKIPFCDVLKCEMGTWPGIGSLTLRRPMAPWGKLYFVIETHDGWLPKGTRLAQYINEKARGKVVAREAPDMMPAPRTARQDRLRCLAAFGGGIAYGAVTTLAGSFQNLDPVFKDLATRQFGHWPWNAAIGALMAFVVLALRFRKGAWAFALGLGGMIGDALTRVLL